MLTLNNLKNLWNDDEAKGDLFKGIGIGFFVNGGYGLSDSSIEIYNIVDSVIGIVLLISGIILERREKWDT